ncbi:MAG TPA: murein L,D-transpeptidase [Actinobacteria bacterium]|nr:murein L,D-transpeptidase [Actinomycetota bacterium]
MNSDKTLTQLIDGPIDKDKVKIVISKSKYKLTVFYNRKPVKDYMIVMGGDPVNDKRREGDKRTPEGELKVRDLYPHKSWSKFIWINYPTQASWQKHNQAKADGEISEGDTIGGEIGLHGVPVGNDQLVTDGVNWTTGCVSLTNKDVNEIYDVMKVGTPITITH